jgi:Protein of unknown function (DUF3551)
MRKSITAGLTLWAALTAFGGEAQARINYPWCITSSRGVASVCTFSTREQCEFGGRNRGFGECIQNPGYDPRKGPVIEESIPGQPPALTSRSR